MFHKGWKKAPPKQTSWWRQRVSEMLFQTNWKVFFQQTDLYSKTVADDNQGITN